MPDIDIGKQLPLPATIVAMTVTVALSLGLSACGGSSSSSSSSSTTVAANVSPPPGGGRKAPGTGAAGGSGFAGMRACLRQHGITLPPPSRGGGGPGRGAFSGHGPQLPKGVTRAQLQAALAKCGGPAGFRGRRFGGPNRFTNPALRTALAKFATCMRQHGVDVPAPNTSGNGPVFSTKGIDTASAQFKAAQTKCQGILGSAFPRRPGGRGRPGAGSGG